MSLDTQDAPVVETPESDDFVVTSNSPVETLVAESVAPVTDPDDDAPAQEPDPASDAGKALAKKRGSLQTRINELTRERHETRREADAARAEVAALRLQLEQMQRPAQAEPSYVPQDGKPTADQFDNYDDFVEAKAVWAVEQRLREQQQREYQAQQQRQQHELQSSVAARIDAFRAEHPDYDEVVNSIGLPDTAAAGAILAHLQHSDFGPALAYELGKNPAEMTRLASLAPGFAVAALGRLEAQIESRTAAAHSGPVQTPAITKAKPPIKPVGGSPSVDDGPPPESASLDEHAAYWDRKEARRQR